MPVISGGNVNGTARPLANEVTITEAAGNNAAGTYNADVVVPAGSYIVDIIVHAVALWNSAGACTLIVGDGVDPDCYFTGVDLKATDLLAAEGLSLSGGTGLAGGKVGADVANSQFNRRYLATERTVRATVTCAAASGSTGVTRVIVEYLTPSGTTAATFTAA
jgi:hypothetical protein